MGYNPEVQYNLLELLQKADSGDLEAMETAVSFFVDQGYLDNPDIYNRYLSYLQKMAEAKSAVACIMLGDTYAYGDGVPADPDKAIRYYDAAAQNGENFGNECIGMLYYSGKIVPRNYQKAFEYFMKGGAHKSLCTLYMLGEMYRLGLYVGKSPETACDYYSKIVFTNEKYPEKDDNYWCACYRLGHALHVGEGIEIDHGAAYTLLSKAKALASRRASDARDAGITYDEVFQEWAEMSRDMDLL